MADSLTKNRPLIVWMHGGGFKFGSKNSKEISIWGNAFAKRGYAFAAINYRLSKKNTLTNFKELIAACAYATEDAKQAIQFFKTNYTRFRIDTNRIILGGNSAGGIIALQTIYSNPTELAKLSEIKNETVDTLNDNNYKIAAIINFWGALFDTAWLKNAHVPIVSVHGRKDKTVPIGHQENSFFGSLNIHEKADSLHIPNDIKIYEDYAHELKKHFNPFLTGSKTKKRWEEAAGFAAGFLYSTLHLQDICCGR